jgi:hypothetical protein
MNKMLVSALFAVLLFGGMLGCLRLGWILGRRRLREAGDDANAGLGAIEGGIFGLMGLLIAFTFTGAANRFQERRELITQQVNAIGTAWLRLDLLAPEARDRARDQFRRYLDAVIEISRGAGHEEAIAAGQSRLNGIQNEIWGNLIVATKTDKSLPLAQTVLPPVNEMFDIGTSRLLVTRQHPPPAVFAMLGVLVLLGGLVAGYGMAKSERQSRLHVFGFAAVLSLSVYLILDIEYPRLGLVRVDSFDRALHELRATMN